MPVLETSNAPVFSIYVICECKKEQTMELMLTMQEAFLFNTYC